MDYGKLTDHLGKTVDFTNVILIMTSNVGASELVKENIGFLESNSKLDNEKEIKNYFSPEFRNRLDAVVNFQMLNSIDSLKVVEKFLIELESLLVEKDLSLNVSKIAKQKLLEMGFDVNYGARPMERVIQEKIKIPLSELLLKIKNKRGEIKVDYNLKKSKFSVLHFPLVKKNETISH